MIGETSRTSVMVNTFLTYEDYRQSARSLDSRRLNKQITEAIQILELCYDYHVLGKLLGIPLPINIQDSSVLLGWVSSINLVYYRIEYVAVRTEWVAFMIPSGSELVSAYQPFYRRITLGFGKHPAIYLWLGYEDSLKQYINAHIEEFVSRGFRHNYQIRPLYQLSEGIIKRPAWSLDPLFHQNHRSALYYKELTSGYSNEQIKTMFPQVKTSRRARKIIKAESPW